MLGWTLVWILAGVAYGQLFFWRRLHWDLDRLGLEGHERRTELLKAELIPGYCWVSLRRRSTSGN